MPAAMPCKIPIKSSGETHRNIGKRKTKYTCVVDADECTRPRLEGAGHKPHQYHITAKGMNSITRYCLVHKFIPMPQAFKISDAKAAVEKEWENWRKFPWQLTKVRNKKEVIEEARNKGRKVHFASFMDLCHLKNSELEPKYQKYKGRVVPRGDIAKDDSGLYAVFTEEGSSASQMTSAKVLDIISRLPGCLYQGFQDVQGKQLMQYPLILRSKWKLHQHYFKFHDTNGPNHGPEWKTQSFLSKGICTVIFWQDYCGKGNLRKFYWNTVGKKFLNWECLFVNRARGLFLSVYVDDIKLAGIVQKT